MVNNSNPPTAEHVGLASWTARRQFADGRQNSRLSTPGLAGDERDGEEQDGPGPPYQPKPTAESHLALPVVTEQAESHLAWPVATELATTHPALPVASEPQCAPGIAGATDESLPCPGDDRSDLLGVACSDDGEAAATGHSPASLPLRPTPATLAQPEAGDDAKLGRHVLSPSGLRRPSTPKFDASGGPRPKFGGDFSLEAPGGSPPPSPPPGVVESQDEADERADDREQDFDEVLDLGPRTREGMEAALRDLCDRIETLVESGPDFSSDQGQILCQLNGLASHYLAQEGTGAYPAFGFLGKKRRGAVGRTLFNLYINALKKAMSLPVPQWECEPCLTDRAQPVDRHRAHKTALGVVWLKMVGAQLENQMVRKDRRATAMAHYDLAFLEAGSPTL